MKTSVVFSLVYLAVFTEGAYHDHEDFHQKVRFNYYHGLEPPIITRKTSEHDKYFQQRVDHFNPLKNKTWQQRYFSSMKFYEQDGPIFIYIGGEGPGIDYSRMEDNSLMWQEWAVEHKAAMFMLEHRYYGLSYPPQDDKSKQYEWLSSRQALMDLATFIEEMQTARNFSGPWIAFGGSYPGSLAAWAREKYPNLIKGAVSSSAPLLAKVNFFEYWQLWYKLNEVSRSSCNHAITESIKQLELLVDDRREWDSLQDKFKLCTPFNGTATEDQATFMDKVISRIVLPGSQNGWQNTTEICSVMEDESIGLPLERLIEWNSRKMESTCDNYTYQYRLKYLRDSMAINHWMGSWYYQKCTEFAWFHTFDAPNEVFGKKVTPELFIKTCEDIYGDVLNMNHIETLVEETNTYYGARELKVENVVFVNGDVDPWHTLGRLTNVNEKSPAILIPGASHCEDMFSNEVNDSEALRHAKKMIGGIISKWIQEERLNRTVEDLKKSNSNIAPI